MHKFAAFPRPFIFLGILFLSAIGSPVAHGQTADGGIPTTSETEKGAFVRQLLSYRQLRVGSCRFARAECERLMDEFVRGKDADFLEPALKSENGQDAVFRELVAPCLPPPAERFFDTDEFYRATVEQVGGGNTIGPFSVYRLPGLADSTHQGIALIRMSGFRFQSGDPGAFNWTKYARLDPNHCEKDQKDNTWLFQLGDDTLKKWKIYFTDGIVRLGDEYYIFTLRQSIDRPQESFDSAVGSFSVGLWKLQSDLRALSIVGFHAE
jgi:hypothetical protein